MSDESLSFLIARLSHSEYSERRKAEDALVALGEAAIASLIVVVEQQGIVAALRAASALFRLGDTRGILPVARLLLRVSLDVEIVSMLARWQPVPQAGTPEFEVVVQARKYHAALGYQGFSRSGQPEMAYGELVSTIRSHSPSWAPPGVPTAYVSTVVTPEDIPGLLQALRSTSHATRSAATAKLVTLGSAAVPALLEALEVDSPLVRYRAIEALGQIGDARAVEPLLKLRKSFDSDIMESAYKALLSLARHLAVNPVPAEIPQLIALIQHLRFDASLQPAASSAARALEKLARTQPTPQLRGALKWLKAFWAPLPAEFKEVHRAIEEATQHWKDLPLIAEASPSTDSLPRPVQDRGVDHD